MDVIEVMKLIHNLKAYGRETVPVPLPVPEQEENEVSAWTGDANDDREMNLYASNRHNFPSAAELNLIKILHPLL